MPRVIFTKENISQHKGSKQNIMQNDTFLVLELESVVHRAASEVQITTTIASFMEEPQN